jgi:hypothetical protein
MSGLQSEGNLAGLEDRPNKNVRKSIVVLTMEETLQWQSRNWAPWNRGGTPVLHPPVSGRHLYQKSPSTSQILVHCRRNSMLRDQNDISSTPQVRQLV